jgi:hypothetical protein
MATITLVTPCPSCVNSKKINRLMQTLGEDAVFCREGHTFASVEEAEKPIAAPKPRAVKPKAAERPVEAAPPAPAAVAVMDPPPNLESIETSEEQALAVFDEAREQEVAEVLEEIVEGTQGLKETAELETVVEAAEEEVAQAHTAPPKIVRVQPREMLSHGSMVLRVEIPDQFVSMLQATADSMGKPLEEYFGEIIQGGLENSWFF